MKKLHIVGLAFAAVFALFAISASSAFAESEFLLSGQPITEPTATQSSGELELEDSKAPIVGKAKVKCSGILDGSIAAGGKLATITEVLNLSGEKVALGGLALDCTSVTGCEGLAEVWPEHLPWDATIELMTAAPIWLLHLQPEGAGEPGYTVLCKVFGVSTEDACEGLISGEIMMGPPLEVLFNEAVGTEKGNCTLGGTGAGIVAGSGVITANNGLELTVS